LKHLAPKISQFGLDLIGSEFEIGFVIIKECFEDEFLCVIKLKLIDEDRNIAAHEIRLQHFLNVTHATTPAAATTPATAAAATTTTTTTATFTTAVSTASAITTVTTITTITTVIAVTLCRSFLSQLKIRSKTPAQAPDTGAKQTENKKVPRSRGDRVSKASIDHERLLNN
jgi:hypothetical protein